MTLQLLIVIFYCDLAFPNCGFVLPIMTLVLVEVAF